VAAAGGILSLEDLARYRVRWRAPLHGQYRGHAILTMPLPSAGGLAVVQALTMFESAFPQPPAFHDPEAIHVLVESLRRIYADRVRWLGDPAFNDVPLDRLGSRAYLEELLAGIDRAHATPSASLLELSRQPPQEAQPEQKNTTHISVVDRQGNAVTMTTTLNYGFGSGLVARGTGILLNDEMDDFAAKPLAPNVYGLVTGEANAVAPGKIPLSSMAPTLVFQKDDPSRVMLALGSPGGSTIPTTVIQAIQNVIDLGLDPGRAVAMGRVHHQFLPDVLQVDRWGLEVATRRALEAKGHVVKEVDPWGDGEAVMVDPRTGLRMAGSDPRNEGMAVGEE
jgi:gamma-glutamyltranspeptidase/glutathione hydrolase